MRTRMWFTALMMATLLLSLGAILRAEAAATTGSISGIVVDEKGKAVAGAEVSVLIVYADHRSDPKEVKTATSGDDGTFKVDGLEASGYIVKASTKTLAGNKSATVKAGKDTAIGKLTIKATPPAKTAPRETPKKG